MTYTQMDYYFTCGYDHCHGLNNEILGSLDTRARHNFDRSYGGTPGYADMVYLNNQISLTVVEGAIVNVTSRVNDKQYTGASRVGGAEYYIDFDPGEGKGIPMDASDGFFDAVNGNWESVNATINTSNLSGGNHTIFVRGMDIGKQWSAPKNATLFVDSSHPSFLNNRAWKP